MIAVVTIIGVLAALIVPAIAFHGQFAKQQVCHQFKSDLNAAIEKYFMDLGTWPDEVSDLEGPYYPEKIPKCPVDNTEYTIDPNTHRISGHEH